MTILRLSSLLKTALAFSLLVLMAQVAAAQCVITRTSNNGQWSISVEVTPVGVNAPTNCPWGFSYTIDLEYNITFTGNPPNSTNTLQGTIGCGNNTQFFNLPNTGGSGVVTTANSWWPQTNCATATPESLGCNTINLQIEGPGMGNQTISCQVEYNDVPPSHPSLVCGSHIVVVDENLSCEEFVEIEALTLAGVVGAYNPDDYYMVNDLTGTSIASGNYPPGVSFINWTLYHEPTNEIVSECTQTVEVVLGDLYMLCENQFDDYTWRGTLSDEWNVAGNWLENEVPPVGANVTIDTQTYDPRIEGTESVNNILIRDGSAIDFAFPSSNLEIAGDFVNNGQFHPLQGRVSFTGIGNRLVKGDNTPIFHGLRVDVQDTLLLLTAAHFTGSIEPRQGVFNILAHRVTLLANDEYAGGIGEIKNGADIIGDSVAYQRWVGTGPASWRMLCAPFTDVTFEQWNDDFPTTGFPGADFAAWPNAANPWASIRSYDESITGNNMHSGFEAIDHITDTIENGTGYFVYFAPNNTSVDMEGTFGRGTKQWELSHTDSEDDPYQDGWSLLGNPYPSAIDWNSALGWQKNNIAAALYAYDATNGQYSSYINGIQIGNLDGTIGSMQAFWVKAEGPNATVAINERAKVNTAGVFFKSTSNNTQGTVRVKLTTPSPSVWDETVFGFNLYATNEFDSQHDAYKFFSNNTNLPGIATVVDTNDTRPMGISMLAPPQEELMINLHIRPGNYTNFTIANTEVDAFDDELCLVLEDLEEETLRSFNQGESYEFTKGEIDLKERFRIRVSAPLDVAVLNESCPDADDGRLVAQGFGEAPWTFTWFDEIGQIIRTTEESTVADVFEDLTPGFYEVQVDNSSEHCNSTFKIVQVKAAPEGGLEIDTHPATCNTLEDGYIEIIADETYTWSFTANRGGDETPRILNEFSGDTLLVGLPAGWYDVAATNNCGTELTLGPVDLHDPIAVEAEFTTTAPTASMLNGGMFTFINNSSFNANRFVWDFGDGNADSTNYEPQYAYASWGNYTVKLIAANELCADTTYMSLTVTGMPGSNGNAGDMAGLTGLEPQGDDGKEPGVKVIVMPERLRITAEEQVNEPVSVMIFNLAGQQVLTQDFGNLEAGNTEMDISSLRQGLYTYGVQTASRLLESGEFVR